MIHNINLLFSAFHCLLYKLGTNVADIVFCGQFKIAFCLLKILLFAGYLSQCWLRISIGAPSHKQ